MKPARYFKRKIDNNQNHLDVVELAGEFFSIYLSRFGVFLDLHQDEGPGE